MKTIVIGLGNPILGDDGIGWKVVEAIQGMGSEVEALLTDAQAPIDFELLAVGGISLMENLIGYDQAIIVDAIDVGAPQGSVICFPLAELPDLSGGHTTSTHDASLQTAVKMGKDLGAHLPDEIYIVGIEAENVYDFSEEMSAPVAAAVLPAAQKVLELLRNPEGL